MSTGLSRPRREIFKAGPLRSTVDAGFAQLVQHGAHVIGARAAEDDFAAAGGGGHRKGRGFDAVGNDLVLRAVQTFHAGDGEGGAARARDLGAHGVEEIGQVHHLRFAGGAFDQRHAVGQRGRHHDVGRAEDRRAAAPAQEQIGALQLFGAGVDVAAVNPNFCAQRLQALEMQVNRARANDATARQGDHRLAAPPQQRTENAHRAAHLADQIIIAQALDPRGAHGERCRRRISLPPPARRGFRP